MDIGVMPNATILVQLFIFVIFLMIITNIYVKPYTAVIESREELIKKNLSEAQKLREETQTYLTQAKEVLEDAKKRADQIIENARREAEAQARSIIEQTEKQTEEEIKKAVEEIRTSLEEEKKKLEKSVKEIAQEIVKKILREAA
ncbi:ATP synthase F0 subunit B [Aquifex aeolicus]|uniref:ATP synthase subunit b n=1 Tax=Aquifex aeolicus (strain VF5) TaxID=224324 RepID=O67525_AQUAE|nr:ATP synthase F0 subunit B [Aquifex aeolicus]AAC07477.1 ATP synthase F0 subunit b [Aquifex aeolicus VF5]